MHSSEDQLRQRQLVSRFTAVRFAPIEPFHPVAAPSSNSELPIVYLEDCNSRCGICLADFALPWETEAGAACEKLSQLPCSHVFHTDCIKKWISPESTSGEDESTVELTLNDRCPSCRSDLWLNNTSEQRVPEINAPISPIKKGKVLRAPEKSQWK
ncbi:hypothetical protein OG21DRAFT_1606638 [Imleria badia]|nr:hypothetical protein OG21DRAFT_1606638 [Imleria badia]